MGFQLRYNYINLTLWKYRYGECGGNFTTPNGRFTSPSYPDNYPSNANCIYTVSQGSDTFIALTFHKMNTEKGFDELEIRDGPSMNSTLIAIFSGNEVPDSILSGQGQVWIK